MATFKVEVQPLLDLLRRRRTAEVKTLKNVLIKYIAENVGDYVRGEVKLENLPLCLREMVLRQLMQRRCQNFRGDTQDNVDRMIEAYSQLVCHKTKKLEMEGFFSYCSYGNIGQDTTKALEAISRKATELEHLDLLEKYPRRGPCLEKNSIQAILRMENLEIIKFAMVEYTHVKLVCKNLKKLQHVRCDQIEFAENEDIEANIEDFKSTFSQLRAFIFCPYRKLRKLCFQHLPKLEVYQEYSDFTDVYFFDPLPDLTMQVKKSAMRQLETVPTTFDLPAAFPNVTHLNADCSKIDPVGQHGSILKFTRIESLVMRVNTVACNLFLEAYGANLHTLIIFQYTGLDISFKRIFDACPKLQKLVINWCVHISDDNTTIESFAQLREFHWQPCHNYEVTNILMAPNLEKFSLDSWSGLQVGELQKLKWLVAKNKALCKLTSFSLWLKARTNDYETDNELLRALRDFIAVAAVNLPNLAHFKLSMTCFEDKSLSYESDRPEGLCKIGARSKALIGDDSIVEFISAINAKNKM